MFPFRYLEDKKFLSKAEDIFRRLRDVNCFGSEIYHSSIDSHVQEEGFLQDSASVLLFLTYLHEETGMFTDEMDEFFSKVQEYRVDGEWIESSHGDFLKVPADIFDYPIPSSVSMAELAILRADLLRKREHAPAEFSVPLARDFFNIGVLIRNGFFHLIESPAKITFSRLPGNTIQVLYSRLHSSG
ncbi:MAG: hypothetical protein Q7K98_06565 [Candidatus Omnitrophota bacterium]|nr:hypothetical protein [Candidatus Omnitrophota bacterium]